MDRANHVTTHTAQSGHADFHEFPLNPRHGDPVGVPEQKRRCIRTEVRPQLTVQAIWGFQTAGVEPDVWRLEGIDFNHPVSPLTPGAPFTDEGG